MDALPPRNQSSEFCRRIESSWIRHLIPLVCLRTERSKARPLVFSLQEGSVISIVTWCLKALESDRPIESLDPQVACQATFFPTLTRLLSPLPMSLGPVPLLPRLLRSSTRWPPTLNWAMNNPKIRPHAANHSNHQVIHVLIIDGAFFAPHNNNKLQWILWLENWSVVLEWLFRKKNLYDPPLGFLLAATLPLCGKTKDEKTEKKIHLLLFDIFFFFTSFHDLYNTK